MTCEDNFHNIKHTYTKGYSKTSCIPKVTKKTNVKKITFFAVDTQNLVIRTL